MSRGVLLKKLSPADQPAGGGLDALGESDGGVNRGPIRAMTCQHKGKVKAITPKNSGKCGLVGDSVSQIGHARSVAHFATLSIPGNVVFKATQSHLEAMDIWPQRKTFRTIAQQWAKDQGLDRAGLAARLEINEGSLHSLFYDKSRKAGLDLLKRSASLFGCSITQFIDDPGSPAPMGIDGSEWSEVSERTRVLASAMFQDLRALPEDEQQIYYELWKKGQEIGRARLAAEAKEKLQAESEPEKTKKPQRR